MIPIFAKKKRIKKFEIYYDLKRILKRNFDLITFSEKTVRQLENYKN